jgi:hypothetical protein
MKLVRALAAPADLPRDEPCELLLAPEVDEAGAAGVAFVAGVFETVVE